MRRKLELLKLQIKSAFLSIPKIILGTVVTAVLVIVISTCVGIATAQDSDLRMKVAVVYPDYDETENSDSADDNKEFRYIKMAMKIKSADRPKALGDIRGVSYIYPMLWRALSTRGGQSLRHTKRHPTLEDNVTVYSGASILGGETVIGQGAVIGSNAFITSSVPANMRVSIKNPELQFKDRSGKVGELGQEGFFNRKETD